MAINNNVAKSEIWCLEVVNNDDNGSEDSVTEMHFLNIGKTTIGRNMAADMCIASEVASRNHCFIELTDSDEVFLTDSSSNGTYVNADAIVRRKVQLKMNDLIGIGCSVNSRTTATHKFFVYKLVNLSEPQIREEVIVLSDDEHVVTHAQSEIGHDAVVPNGDASASGNHFNVLDLLEPGDEMLVDCVSCPVASNEPGHVGNRATTNKATLSNGNGVREAEIDAGVVHAANDIDDEQYQWSQQVVLNIKEEAQQCIVISDDEDATSKEGNDEEHSDDKQDENDNEIDNEDDLLTSRWLSILSQDQDKVHDKPSMKKEQKMAKMIDSLPKPMKRRQSVSSRTSANASLPKRRKSISASSTASSTTPSPVAVRRKSVSAAPPIAIKLDGFITPSRHMAGKRDLVENRKARLSEIAYNQHLAKLAEGGQSKERIATKPKVKISESRGTFLQAPIVAERKRLKSKSEVDEVRKQHQLVGVASTSRGPPTPNEPGSVDHLDPFVVRGKPVQDKPKTIDEAFAEVDKQYMSKKRISRVKSTIERAPIPGPMLKQPGGGNQTRKRKVFFRDEVTDQISGKTKELEDVLEFEAEIGEDAEILVNVTNGPRSRFQTDPLHGIISDVTLWNVDWLINKCKLPPIMGNDYVITPLLSKYPSFEVFQNTITPLLKHELWASIIAEMEKDPNTLNNKIRIAFNDVNLEKRGTDERFVYHCEVVSKCVRAIRLGDLVVVNNGSLKFFAYVTDQRNIRGGAGHKIAFSMEAAPMTANKNITRDTHAVSVTPISNIRSDLKLFSAVYTLKNSAMKQYILNPLANIVPKNAPRGPKFVYKGYDPLNKEQLDALESIYGQCVGQTPGVSLVEGPPGTGKSRLIVNLILQLVFGRKVTEPPLRILVCAHSNLAVDVLALKLLRIRTKTTREKQDRLGIVRFGMVEKMDRDVRGISMQQLVKNRINADIQSSAPHMLLEERNRLVARITALSKSERANDVSADELSKLRRHLENLNVTLSRTQNASSPRSKSEREHTHELMVRANIICTTLSSSINLPQYVRKFNVCIVDEASQCIEPWSMIPLLFDINSLILVGDSQQLPAVVLSTVGKDNNLERSLFTRLQENCVDVDDKPNVYSLREQYRMHPQICHWPNKYFYRNRLVSAPSTIETKFQLNSYGVFSLEFMQSCNGGANYRNADEARFIVELLKIVICYADPKRFTYGIITPYSTQRNELQSHINKSPQLSAYNFPVNTIDSYQGQEKDVIVLSTTRTDGVGFLNNPQRLNVALTRAKRCLLVCGNFTSIKQVRVWSSLLKDATERGLLHNVPREYTKNDMLKMLLRPDAADNGGRQMAEMPCDQV